MTDIFPESREEEILVSTINGEEYDKAPESRIEALLLELKEVIEEGGGGGGTTNYNLLSNKPSINSVTLTGNKSLEDLSIPTAADLAGKQDALPVTASGNDVAFNGEIIDGQGNTLSVLAEALTKTASGNPVVITDCAGGKARSLKTTINAIQDLHGYDKPWAGGAYKNKYKMRTTSATVNGITVIPNSDQTVQLSGTATGGPASIPLCDNLSEISTLFGNGGTFILSLKEGTYSGTLNVSIAYVETQGGATKYLLPNTPTEIPAGSIAMSSNLYIASGTTVQSLSHFAIQLESGSTATSFAPYSNICPISGRTAAVVTRSDGDEISEDFTIQFGQTVYGADINWDTGVMTVKTILVDNGTLTWVEQNTAVSNKKRFYAVLSPSAVEASSDNLTSKSSLFSLLPAAGTYQANKDGYTITSDNRLYIYADAYSSATAAEFKAAMSGVQVEYTLATPTTIQLTPEQLEMLKGYNRVTIDNGTITLDYIAKAISGNDEEIAPLVGDKATKSYAVNDFIERNDGLYRVTTSIASGASFTANNTVKMSIGEALTYLYNK